MTQSRANSAAAVVGSLELIQLRTGDPVATAEWYRDVLGATVQMTSPYWSRVRLGNVDLGIHEGTPPAESGWEPAFRVLDIAEVRAALEAQGVEITQPYHDIPGGVKLGFRDVAGNALAVYQYGVSVADLEGGEPH